MGITWTNFEEFLNEQRALAETLQQDAEGILRAHAGAAKADVVAAYPTGPGKRRGRRTLKKGVKLIPAKGEHTAGVTLKQTAPHGHLFERGTVLRSTKTGRNRFGTVGHSTGAMPRNPTLEPIAAGYQKAARSELVALAYEHGAARVTVDDD